MEEQEKNTQETFAQAQAESQRQPEQAAYAQQPVSFAQAPQDARYSRYYEAPGSAGRRRGIGGYILTAILAFIIGALFGSLFLTPAQQSAPDPAHRPEFSFEIPPFWEEEQEEQSRPQAQASPTPLPTPRPSPAVDGAAPKIESGSLNPIPEIIAQVHPGVIGVNGYTHNAFFDQETASSFGTGFIFSSQGYVMTCEHIIRGAERITVTMQDGSEIDAELMGADKTLDIAVLKIEAEELCVLKMGDSDSLRVGDFVIAIGNPTGYELSGTATYGIVSGVSRTVNIEGSTNTYIQTDAAVNPGNSGGALLNMKGEVVGLTSAKTITASYDEYGNAISAEGLGFATPINLALETANQLVTQGYVRHPGIGISVVTMDAASAETYGTPEGIVVYSVTKDGPGEKAGLKANDIILSCDGQALKDQEAFVEYIKTRQVGDALTLTVWRFGESFETEIVLGDLNEMGDEIVDNAYANFDFYLEE